MVVYRIGRQPLTERGGLEAYASDLLPAGPRLRAPRCLASGEDALELEDVAGPPPTTEQAAAALATWQVPYADALDRPWLAIDQLGRRLDATDLDWAAVDADRRVIELWARRAELLAELRRLPRVLAHGDFSIGNLVLDDADGGPVAVVAYDWATFGWEPVGFDLAHLALSTGEIPPLVDAATEAGFRRTVALVGASRVHWMLEREVDVPPRYVDLVWEHRP